jgi:hypothetical protein
VNPQQASKVKYVVNNVYYSLELGGTATEFDEAA